MTASSVMDSEPATIMKLALLSDIHANLQAFDACLADAARARRNAVCVAGRPWSAMAPIQRQLLSA